MKSKKNISETYIKLIKLLDDDNTFVACFNLMPMETLLPYVPENYLLERYDYLKKTGKLKDWSKKSE